jgi:small subunit ribosomal protein S9
MAVIDKKTTKKTSTGLIQTVGRRKRAIARVRLTRKGKGQFIVNDKPLKEYFQAIMYQNIVNEPLPLVGLEGETDISVKVLGGGHRAQAEAIRLGIARALLEHNEEWRQLLRKMGWLTRDPRIKERKKPGLKRARRAPQWAKR